MTPADDPRTPADELLDVLGLLDAEPAPAGVRDRLLAAAAAEPRPGVEPLPPLDVFEECVRAFGDLVSVVPSAVHRVPVDAYPWDATELLAHVAAVERHTRSVLGLEPDDHDPERLDHLAVGRAWRSDLVHRGWHAVADTWRAAADATIADLRAGRGPAPGTVVQLHQWPLDLAALLVVRSFELWTHADDLRRASGIPMAAPSPAALRAMSSASVRALPLLASVVAGRDRLRGVRVVLTGDGGGTHDLGADERTTTVVADVVDYCRLVARRAEPSVLEVHGDPTPIEDLVRAAQAFAM